MNGRGRYFLTDTTIPFSGAMRIVPGSHKMGDPPPAGTVDPPGAIDIRVKPGTAVLCESCVLLYDACLLDYLHRPGASCFRVLTSSCRKVLTSMLLLDWLD
jgi:hypothetical protein|eukprot:COSAG02_NODE_160_length_32694_cov_18.496947_11_plen_101_part_00